MCWRSRARPVASRSARPCGAPARPRADQPDGRGWLGGARLVPGRAARRPGGALPGTPAARRPRAAGRRSAATTRSRSRTPCASLPCRRSRHSPGPGRRCSSCGVPGFRLGCAPSAARRRRKAATGMHRQRRPARRGRHDMFTGIVEGTGTVQDRGAARRRDGGPHRGGRAVRGAAARGQRGGQRLLPDGRALGRAGLRRRADRGDAAPDRASTSGWCRARSSTWSGR